MTGPVDERPVLSIFPGIDMLGMGFEMEGYCVVRGPDPIFGGDVRFFRASSGHFQGVIGGPPCQEFSRDNRDRDPAAGIEMLREFARVVTEAQPEWFVCENVPTVPELAIHGYEIQRFTVDCREVGNPQSRNRMIQFGSRDSSTISLDRVTVRRHDPFEPAVMASEGKRATRRRFDEVCRLQGLPPGFELPSFTVEAAYKAVGNGVPIQLARELARAVTRRSFLQASPKCICGCGRDVPRDGLQHSATCRKRMQRRRENVSGPGPVTWEPATGAGPAVALDSLQGSR